MPFSVPLVSQAAASVVFCMVYFYSRKGLDGLAATQIWSCTYHQFKRQSKRFCHISFPWSHISTFLDPSRQVGCTIFDRIDNCVMTRNKLKPSRPTKHLSGGNFPSIKFTIAHITTVER